MELMNHGDLWNSVVRFSFNRIFMDVQRHSESSKRLFTTAIASVTDETRLQRVCETLHADLVTNPDLLLFKSGPLSESSETNSTVRQEVQLLQEDPHDFHKWLQTNADDSSFRNRIWPNAIRYYVLNTSSGDSSLVNIEKSEANLFLMETGIQIFTVMTYLESVIQD